MGIELGIGTITLAIVLSLFFLMAIGVPLGASTLLISVTTSYLAFGELGSENGNVPPYEALIYYLKAHEAMAYRFISL